MAYKALYRTYRPNSFEEVAGQKHIVQTLKNAVEQNKIAHAYLFCGPRGTGKTSIAKIFAKTINCSNEQHKPCLECENCIEVAKGNHPDIIEIDAASNNGVEEVRTLIEKVKYAPLIGKYKVYIIDEVHMMSTGAFNALLKTIEEPPAHVIFILATTEPHKVIPTIISRCQRFDFTKVSNSEIIRRLHTVLEAEHINCEDEVVRIIAQLADGGLRDALSILDQCIAYAKDNLQLKHIHEIYGITTITEKLQLLDYIFQKDAVELLNCVSVLLEKGIDVKRLTVDLIELLKESVIFEYTKETSLLQNLTSDEVTKLVVAKSLTERLHMIDVLMETYDKYKSAANVGSYFEVCLLKMLDVSIPVNVQQVGTQQEYNKPIPQKQVINKTSQKPLFEKRRDVSRETIQPILNTSGHEVAEEVETYNHLSEKIAKPILEEEFKEDKSAKPLDDEFVLGLLVGANKNDKVSDIESFKRVSDYLMDFTWARLANLLRNKTIVASGTNYIILGVGNQAEANEINEKDSENNFADFLMLLLGKYKKIFAISIKQTEKIIANFKERMANGTLPVPVVIEDIVIEKKVVKEKTQEEAVLELFGKENITIMEE